MKWRIIVAVALSSVLLSVHAAEGKFTASVTPEDLAAAGLNGLTPAQLARLNAMVEEYKSGTITRAKQAADDAVAARKVAEAQAARAEQKAEAARQDAAKVEARRVEAAKVETPKPTASPGWLTQAKERLKPASATAGIESTIPGKFRGWEPRQVFTLANGQRWQVANSESYYAPVTENPKVVIVPASVTGYWMRFPALGTEVRVILLGEN